MEIFADDSCDALMNSSVRNGDSSDDLSEDGGTRQVASDNGEYSHSIKHVKEEMDHVMVILLCVQLYTVSQ